VDKARREVRSWERDRERSCECMVRDMEEGVAAADVDDERAERRREEVEAEREDVEAERERVWVGSSEECRDGEATAGGSVHRDFLMNEGRRSSTSCLCDDQVVESASSHLFPSEISFIEWQKRRVRRTVIDAPAIPIPSSDSVTAAVSDPPQRAS
jgi:hypothetical protein